MSTVQNFYNLHDVQRVMINAAFSALEVHSEEAEWDALCNMIDRALRDPDLPLYDRIEYETIHAWHGPERAEHIQRAKDGIEELRFLLRHLGRSEAYIARYLSDLEDTVDTVEGALTGEDNVYVIVISYLQYHRTQVHVDQAQ